MSIWIAQRTIAKAKEKMFKRIKDERILWLNPFRLIRYMVETKKSRRPGLSPDQLLSRFDSSACDIEDMASLFRLFDKWGERFSNELALRVIAKPESRIFLENVRQIWDRYYQNRENNRDVLEGIPEIEPHIAKFAGSMSKYYRRFRIPKKDGTKRLIEAPVKELIEVQNMILNKILYPCYPKTKNNPAHGFLPDKSILTNATVHENARTIVNLDLKNAFTSTTEKVLSPSLEDYFTEAGAKILLKLCCLNGRLPQGAPTSPMLLNYSLISMDKRMNSFATSVGWRYSRYADDLTFSCAGKDSGTIGIGSLIEKVTKLVAEDYGYKVNKKKIRVCKPKRAMTVTGLTLNSGKPTISRKIRRVIRAKVHNYLTKGTGNKSEIAGHISFISLCHKEYAEKLRKQLEAGILHSQPKQSLSE